MHSSTEFGFWFVVVFIDYLQRGVTPGSLQPQGQ
jgi:hypothetical protein